MSVRSSHVFNAFRPPLYFCPLSARKSGVTPPICGLIMLSGWCVGRSRICHTLRQVEDMNKSSQGKWLTRVSLVYALFLLLFLPATFKLRSPGSVCSEWFICAFATAGLIILNGFGLIALWHSSSNKRFWLYISMGVAVGIALMLLNVWQEQEQFDLWSHRAIRYFDSP